jgi:hypothetical protein
VKQSHKKLKILGVIELMVTTEILFMVDTRKNFIAKASVGVTFSQALEFNIQRMTKEIEEYRQMVEKMEQEVAHYKVDMTRLFEFKSCAFELQDELNTIQRIMYTNL